MKNPHVCKLAGEASVLVPGRAGVNLGPGVVVDLEEVLVPAQPARGKLPAMPAYTMRDALGDLLEHFEPQKKTPATVTGGRSTDGAGPSAASARSAASAEQE